MEALTEIHINGLAVLLGGGALSGMQKLWFDYQHSKESKGKGAGWREQSFWHFTQYIGAVLLAHAKQQVLGRQLSCLSVAPPSLFLRFIFAIIEWCICGKGVMFKCPLRPETLNLPELDLQVIMSCQMWVLGSQFRSSTRVSSVCSSQLRYLSSFWQLSS